MPATTSCPSANDLRQLLLGQAPGPQAAGWQEHLAQCSRCLETIGSLHAEDTLVHALRGPAEESLDDAVLGPLVEQLCALHDERTHSEVGTEASAAGALASLAPPQQPDELGRLGPYRVLQVLGAGGMGVVFLAEDTHLQRRLALKVVKPEAAARPQQRERFLREARAAAAIEHEHVVPVYQVGEEGGVSYLTMPLLRGESLEDRL